jgi:hypothetical protein
LAVRPRGPVGIDDLDLSSLLARSWHALKCTCSPWGLPHRR